MSTRFLPRGDPAEGPHALSVTPDGSMLTYAGLRILVLPPGGVHTWATGSSETAVLPLAGSCRVEVDGRRFDLEGRTGVFDQVTDFAYVPIDAEVRIETAHGGEFAICTAEATRRIDAYSVAAGDVRIEVRGSGPATRQINNFLSADSHDADKLIAVEVLTPGGGWSSYPPHKHDEFTDDEVALEEIYYFRIAGENGIGFFSCYTLDGSTDDTLTVRDGDTYLVPDGYHGPAAAAPGHDMYYLNVMAGPSPERIWKFCDDPAHAWAREAFEELPPDPRMPLATAKG
jgi:5-deoxy-glucuronate isomerase